MMMMMTQTLLQRSFLHKHVTHDADTLQTKSQNTKTMFNLQPWRLSPAAPITFLANDMRILINKDIFHTLKRVFVVFGSIFDFVSTTKQKVLSYFRRRFAIASHSLAIKLLAT